MKYSDLVAAVTGLQTQITNFFKSEAAKADTAAADQVKALETALAQIKAGAEAHEKQHADAIEDYKETVRLREQEISKLKSEATSVDEAAAEKARKLAAAQGIPVNQIPEGTAAGQTTEEKITALQKELADESDPEKSYVLALKIKDLRFPKTEKK